MSFGYTGAQRKREEDLARQRAEEQGEEFKGLRSPTWDFFGKVDLLQTIMFIGLLKLSKTPEGMKIIEKVATEFVKGVFKTTGYLAQASAANKMTGWANPILISGILERFGFIPPGFNTNYHLGITMIAGVDVGKEFLSEIVDALPWNIFDAQPVPAGPTHITFAGDTYDYSPPSEITYKRKKE